MIKVRSRLECNNVSIETINILQKQLLEYSYLPYLPIYQLLSLETYGQYGICIQYEFAFLNADIPKDQYQTKAANILETHCYSESFTF